MERDAFHYYCYILSTYTSHVHAMENICQLMPMLGKFNYISYIVEISTSPADPSDGRKGIQNEGDRYHSAEST